MVGSYVVLGATVVPIGVAFFMLRRWASSKWGYFKSDKNLKGQVIIITGGNVGLGAETVLDLGSRGATLVLACRSWENTRKFLGEARKKTGNNDIDFIKCDLGSLKSVKDFVEEFLAKHDRLDTLICNAGVWYPMDQKKKTDDGFEVHAGVNHLGHFYLANLLQDKLKNGRIVVVSSSLMRSGRLDLTNNNQFYDGRHKDDPNQETPYAPTGYCDSKLMNVLFAKELAKRWTGEGFLSLAVCPGWCKTSLARNVNIPIYKKILFLPIVFLFMRSAARGAHNIIHAAVEDRGNLVSGGFYRECKVSEVDEKRLLHNGFLELTGKLWTISEELCGLHKQES